MKGIMKLFPAALAVVALASCADFDEQTSSKQFAKADGSKIYATIGESGPATRVAMARNEAGNRGLVFVEGDQVNVYNLEASTKFWNYKLDESTVNTDQAVFNYDQTNSSNKTAPESLEGCIAITKSLGADIYGVSPGVNGAELSIQIPEEFKKEDIDASWGDGKTGKGYTMPLPLWGNVLTDDDGHLNSVAFRYLTGFLGINLTTLRAGTKYIVIESDPKEPIAGYFQATLVDGAKLAPHKALTSSNKITIEIDPADYEGATDFFYVPLIAQKYTKLKISAFKDGMVAIPDGVLFEMAAGKSFELGVGKGISLTTGMTVMTDATDGKDLSSKIYELSQRIGNKPFTVGLIADLTTDQTVYIDKNATSTINIQMLNGKKISGNITFVEATCTGWDAATSTASWSTEVTNNLSESQTKKHTVNVIYDNTVANSGDLKFWLPNAAASIASEGLGSVPYTGYVSALTATDGGFTVDESAYINGSGLLVNYKDGPLTIDGFSSYVWQYGNGNVAINNLNDYMNEVIMGTSSQPVTGNLTITGLANTTVHTGTTANKAQVRTITSYSTGTFTASKLDKQNGNGGWTFNETSTGSINITNDGNFITPVATLTIGKKNNLNLTNTLVTTYAYNGKKKANVTANGRSAIKSLTGDADDMLTITSEWDGKSSDDANNVLDGTKGAIAIDKVLGTEIHTAFQLASIKNITAAGGLDAGMKSTTTIDLKASNQWAPIAVAKNVAIDGDMNGQDGSATIKNLTYTPDPTKAAPAYGGFFGNAGGNVSLSSLVFENATVNHVNHAAVLVAQTDEKNVDIDNVVIKGNVTLAATNTTSTLEGSGALIGSIIGTTIPTINIDGVDVTVATITSEKGIAGGLIGNSIHPVSITDAKVTATTIQGEYFAGGMIGRSAKVTLDAAALTQNEITVTTVKTTAARFANPYCGTGGLIGFAVTDAASTIESTKVSAALSGLINLGGFVGAQNGGTLTFGNDVDGKAKRCEVQATFGFGDLNTDANKTAFADFFGSSNTYVGSIVGGLDATVNIKKWCKHGAAIQTATAKEALNYKLNVKTTTDGINTNYHYFFSGNPWIGTVIATGTNTVTFPDDNNVVITAADGTNYNVRRQSPQYIDESFSDWDD